MGLLHRCDLLCGRLAFGHRACHMFVVAFCFQAGHIGLARAETIWPYILAETKDPNIGQSVSKTVDIWKAIIGDIRLDTDLVVKDPKIVDGWGHDAPINCDRFYDEAAASYTDQDVVLLIYSGHGGGAVGGKYVFPKLDCQETGKSAWLEDLRNFFIGKHAGLVVALSDSCDFARALPNTDFPAYIAAVMETEKASIPQRLLSQAGVEAFRASAMSEAAGRLAALQTTNSTVTPPEPAAPHAQVPPALTGLASLFKNLRGSVTGSGSGPTEVSFYGPDGGAYSEELRLALYRFAAQPRAVTWEDVLGYVTAEIKSSGFPEDTVVLVAGKPVLHTQRPMYSISVTPR